MKLGFVSAILPDLDLKGVFEAGKAAGYDCVEVMCWPKGKAERRYAGVTHIDVAELSPDQVKAIHDLAGETGMSISGLGYYPNALSPNQAEADAAVAQLKKVIPAAKTLGLRVVSTFLGRDFTKNVDDNWPRFLETWKPIIALAEDNDIKIAIENCAMLYTNDEWPGGKNLGSSPAIWRRMFSDIPSDHFGLNYDPSHLVWQKQDYIKPLKEFAAKMFRIHIKDAAIDHNAWDDLGVLGLPIKLHKPTLPGSGDIDWKPFLDSCYAIGYDGPFVVEVEDRRYENSLEDRKQALKVSADHVLPLMK